MIRLFAVIVSISLCLGSLVGCTTIGQENIVDHGKYLKLKIGESRKQDIYALFDQPHDVIYKNPSSIWRYYRIDIKINWSTFIPFVGLATGGSDQNIQKTEFVFDSRDLLADLQSKQAARYMNQWAELASAIGELSDSPETRVRDEMISIGLPFDETKIIKGVNVYDFEKSFDSSSTAPEQR